MLGPFEASVCGGLLCGCVDASVCSALRVVCGCVCFGFAVCPSAFKSSLGSDGGVEETLSAAREERGRLATALAGAARRAEEAKEENVQMQKKLVVKLAGMGQLTDVNFVGGQNAEETQQPVEGDPTEKDQGSAESERLTQERYAKLLPEFQNAYKGLHAAKAKTDAILKSLQRKLAEKMNTLDKTKREFRSFQEDTLKSAISLSPTSFHFPALCASPECSPSFLSHVFSQSSVALPAAPASPQAATCAESSASATAATAAATAAFSCRRISEASASIVAPQALPSSTGSFSPLAVCIQASDAIDASLLVLRARHFFLNARLAHTAAQRTAAAQVGAGLHVIDFEQLQAENKTVETKLRERKLEAKKLKNYVLHAIHLLVHARVKVSHTEERTSSLESELAKVCASYASGRDELLEMKRRRKSHRGAGKPRAILITPAKQALLSADYQQRLGTVKTLKAHVLSLVAEQTALVEAMGASAWQAAETAVATGRPSLRSERKQQAGGAAP
eukprot:GHVT01029236.1.p1 GENE.GHVT01029236.1~~GHVT01029236.1.p1  ORF type:complete len:507 (-),score=141.08 GHVT01029236.1:954-2474(-)